MSIELLQDIERARNLKILFILALCLHGVKLLITARAYIMALEVKRLSCK